MLDTGELCVLHLVPIKQGRLLLCRQDPVLWDEDVTCYVDQELIFCELFDVQLGHEVQEALPGKGGEVG